MDTKRPDTAPDWTIPAAYLPKDNTIQSRIFHDLILDICYQDSRYKKGDRVPSATALAAAYSCSKYTAQDVLSRLNDLGVIQGQQGLGTYVVFDMDDVIGHRGRLMAHLRHRIDKAHMALFDNIRRGETTATRHCAHNVLPLAVEDYCAVEEGNYFLVWWHRDFLDAERDAEN
ncbi:GntR family transcriptional regulator [Crossiella sp. NPDC003009]